MTTIGRIGRIGLIGALALLLAADVAAAGRRKGKRRRARTSAATQLEPAQEILAPVAWLYLEQRRYEEALRLFSELLAAQPAQRELHEGRIAACLRSPSCAPQRLPFITEALRRFPDDPTFVAALREARLLAGQGALAEDELRERVRRRPGDAEARLALIEMLDERGRLYQRARHLIELGRALRAALATNPKDPDLWVRYGHYRLEVEDLTGAADATRRALDLTADHHPPARDLGELVREARARRQAAFEREVDRRDLAQDLGWARAD